MRLTEASEQDLIKHILFHYGHLYSFFNFVVEPAIGPVGPGGRGWDYRIYCNIERGGLGLEPQGKPGDVDVLIVPVRDGAPAVQNSMAVEVKRLYLPTIKRSRDTNSSGAEQAQGLVRAGFPFVGVLHIVIAEASLRSELVEGYSARILDEVGNVEILPDVVMIDPVRSTAPFRQFRRLEERVKDPVIGLNSVCLFLSADARRVTGVSMPVGRHATRNSINNPALLRRIEQLCLEMPLAPPSQPSGTVV